MAITTVQGIIDGLLPPVPQMKGAAANMDTTGWWVSSVYVSGGVPAAMTAPSSGTAGSAITSRTGLISFDTPPSGETRLAKMSTRAFLNSTGTGQVMVADRLWDNSGLLVTDTSMQTVNSAAWPARDINASTNGEGVYIGLEISTVLGTGVPTVTLDYTNSAGTAGRTGTLTIPANGSPAGMFYWFTLQAGDTGVRSIQNFTLSATCTSGAFHLVAYRPVYMTIGSIANVSNLRVQIIDDAISLVAPKLWDNTCLQLFMLKQGNGAQSSPVNSYYFSQG